MGVSPKRASPLEAGKIPVSTLKNVVLPDPLGPMRPRISPSWTARSSPWSATTPPNLRVSAVHWSSAATSSTAQPAERPRDDAVRPEEEDEDDERGVEQEPVFLDDLQFLRQHDDDGRGDGEAPGVSESAEEKEGDEDQRLAEAVVVRGDVPDHVRRHRARHAGEEVPERESGDLRPADGDAEGGGAGLVEADGVEGNAHPGALDAYDEREREGSEDERQGDVVEEERSLEWSEQEGAGFAGVRAEAEGRSIGDGLVEPPGTDAKLGYPQPLRTAQRVVDLEEGAEEQREGDGDERRVVAARAQDGKDEHASCERRGEAAGEDHEQVGNAGA